MMVRTHTQEDIDGGVGQTQTFGLVWGRDYLTVRVCVCVCFLLCCISLSATPLHPPPSTHDRRHTEYGDSGAERIRAYSIIIHGGVYSLWMCCCCCSVGRFGRRQMSNTSPSCRHTPIDEAIQGAEGKGGI